METTQMFANYTGVGARATPDHVLEFMEEFAKLAGRGNLCLRSGGASGADAAFERGCDAVDGHKEIYLPWKGFNGNKSILHNLINDNVAKAIAANHHPAWDKCNSAAKKFHTRNVYQILGHDLNNPSQFVMCWTEGGKGRGGTGQAIRIANAYGIPVFDLGDPRIWDFVHNLTWASDWACFGGDNHA